MRFNGKIIGLAVLSLVLAVIFMFTDAGGNWDYVLEHRAEKLLAMVMTGGAIAFSTVIFQTITNNRILTPSIIGLDSLYILLQTALVFFFGSTSAVVINGPLNFFVSLALMLGFAVILYYFLFQGEQQDIFFLLLVGIVCGTLFSSISTFLQVLISPDEFLTIQDNMFASFNNVNTNILGISAAAFVLLFIYSLSFMKYLNVLSLGKDQAVNLGVPYKYAVKRLLVIVVMFISIATALVGPITFLGLLVANVAYELMKDYRHSVLLAAAALAAVAFLIGGQLLVERVLGFNTAISVIVNFIGGIYFIYLLLRGNKAWSR